MKDDLVVSMKLQCYKKKHKLTNLIDDTFM